MVGRGERLPTVWGEAALAHSEVKCVLSEAVDLL